MGQVFIILLMSGLFLVGCGQVDTETNDVAMIEVSITISIDHGEEILAEDTFEVEEGTILLDLLEEEYQIDKTADGFITAIEGVEQGDNRFWLYEVNEEEVNVGAAEFELSADDAVVFDLHAWE